DLSHIRPPRPSSTTLPLSSLHRALPLPFFLLTIRPPPTSTLFPYTTLFRSIHRSTWSRSTARSKPMCRIARSRPRRQNGARSCRSEEHTSELQSRFDLVCRLLLEKKKKRVSSRGSG